VLCEHCAWGVGREVEDDSQQSGAHQAVRLVADPHEAAKQPRSGYERACTGLWNVGVDVGEIAAAGLEGRAVERKQERHDEGGHPLFLSLRPALLLVVALVMCSGIAALRCAASAGIRVGLREVLSLCGSRACSVQELNLSLAKCEVANLLDDAEGFSDSWSASVSVSNDVRAAIVSAPAIRIGAEYVLLAM